MLIYFFFYQAVLNTVLKIDYMLQSAAKLFEHLRFFTSFIANFYSLTLVINSIKPKDHDLTNIYIMKLH